MGYIALYRRHRPDCFSQVEGQHVVVQTLQNALKKNRIGHAYLFAGPRGTGKTSVAKIFARAINCDNAIQGDCCNKCQTCKTLKKETIADIIEIDAASNNGVDEIRELREKSRYATSIAKYKVYIIDEVHMLTTQAFNALLKTLEEPPHNVVFILATTEPHKIPSTIISRCQCFEFKSIKPDDITRKLNQIVKAEAIDIDREAIELIQANSDGALRNAISLLDQVSAYANGRITVDDVYMVSGSIHQDDLLQLLTLINKKDLSGALLLVNKLIADGKQISKITSDLITLLKNLLIIKNTSSKDPQLNQLAKDTSTSRIFYYINVLNQLLQDLRWTNQKQAYFEVATIKMMDYLDVDKSNYDVRFNAIEGKINKLKDQVQVSYFQKALVENEAISTINDKENSEQYTTVKEINILLINGNYNKRISVEKKYLDFVNSFTDSNIKSILTNAKIECVTQTDVLFSVKSTEDAIYLWEDSKYKEISSKLSLLDNSLIRPYFIGAATWKILFNAYYDQLKHKVDQPTLPNVNLGLFKTKKSTNKTVDLAISFFGKENVKIKE